MMMAARTRPPGRGHPGRAFGSPLRRAVADARTPPAALAMLAIGLALAGATLPAWLLTGALAGYSLSGSV